MTSDACVKRSSCKAGRQIQIVLNWLAGFCVGCCIFCVCEPFFLSLMRSLIVQPVSIVGLLASVFLPFLLTYYSIVTNNDFYFLITCFSKALCFGFTGAYISAAFLSAGWLLRFLFLFSDCCTLPLLFLIWFSIPNTSDRSLMKLKFWRCVLLSLVVAITDFWVVSPFLSGLF